MEKLVFLQVDHEDYPAGTPLVAAEKSTGHHQASVMTGVQVPTGYYKVAGAEGPATLAIPRFKGIVGDKHPTDPTVVGPFVCTGFELVDKDLLPAQYMAHVTMCYAYPYVKLHVCGNIQKGGDVIRIPTPKVDIINFREEVDKYLNSLSDEGVDFQVEYTSGW